MTLTSWMVDRLHAETRIHHADVDADLDLLFRPDANATAYMLFLMRVYGFESPLEAAFAMTPGLDPVIDMRGRHKAGLIAQDLLALGLRASDIRDLPQCLTIPQFRGVAEALGWMYVVERTTLAHSVIRRHLGTRLPNEMQHASAYLSAYAGSVGKRWREFGAALDAIARLPAIAERVISSANEAFRCQRTWIRHELTDIARAASA